MQSLYEPISLSQYLRKQRVK
ncbi:hypothetical protein MPL1032_100242 [Mesorhizobium plurifarium]|uniref:Uncharacterized protein n=1 Tax=Mesorhizobium plurifarium TaxID=69974 RepID=A0A0K2VNP3_MESPL|nr:hypothetical protein MPL1032_100242 [Mesorhizobium plurifarium]